MECSGIIYRATNKVTGKIYIGQTTKSLRIRKLSHINDSLSNRDNFYFHNAIRKYGRKNFRWDILEICTGKEEIVNLASFCRDHNLNKGNLCSTAYGRRVHHKGFKCYKMETN